MSKTLRHWCRSVSDFYGGAEMFNGHFGTSAEMSWVRSVLGPKCAYPAQSAMFFRLGTRTFNCVVLYCIVLYKKMRISLFQDQ